MHKRVAKLWSKSSSQSGVIVLLFFESSLIITWYTKHSNFCVQFWRQIINFVSVSMRSHCISSTVSILFAKKLNNATKTWRQVLTLSGMCIFTHLLILAIIQVLGFFLIPAITDNIIAYCFIYINKHHAHERKTINC